MNTSRLVTLCALLLFAGTALSVQEDPPGSRKGKEHRTQKAGGMQNKTALMGDGSVHFLKGTGGTQSSGAGAGKVTKTSGNAGGGALTPKAMSGKRQHKPLRRDPYKN